MKVPIVNFYREPGHAAVPGAPSVIFFLARRSIIDYNYIEPGPTRKEMLTMDLPYFDKFNTMKFDTQIKCSYMDAKKTKVLIEINGDMEIQYSKFFTQAIQTLFTGEKKVKMVFLDFKKVRYVSSGFIASMLHMIQQAKMAGFELYFTNLLEHMEGVIDSLGMGHFVVDIDMKKQGTFDLTCYNCKETITVKKLGQIQCPNCGTVLKISEKGVTR
jgi:anti-anti-sigma factor